MASKEHFEFLQQAIDKSKESLKDGNFPAGAIVVKDGKVIASAISSPYPGLFHADSKAVSEAFEKYGPLEGATLYIGLENCLMCLGVAYWAGIREIYYAVPKSKVSGDYYETHKNLEDLPREFNTPINIYHVEELEEDALQVIRNWEEKN